MSDCIKNHRALQKGFSLIELLVVIAVMTIIVGALFQSIGDAQQISSSEQIKLDLFQESREFVDQMTRDLRSAGYPNTRNFASGSPLISPTSANNAVGLVKIDVGDLWFEGDVDSTGNADGTAVVKVIRYHLDADGPNCPCLRRSETLKVAGDPVTGQVQQDQMELQGVQNGTSAANAIFTAYLPDGTPVTPPIDFTNNASTMAQINSLKVALTVQSKYRDLKTGAFPITDVISTIRLSNCSQALQGHTLSCQ
jgi:prepilin-type N-terminal cleavage/methylation domain-containing protein